MLQSTIDTGLVGCPLWRWALLLLSLAEDVARMKVRSLDKIQWVQILI